MSATYFAPTALPSIPRIRPLAVARRAVTAPVLAAPAVVHQTWLERLALWAESQPQHHRLGSWTR